MQIVSVADMECQPYFMKNIEKKKVISLSSAELAQKSGKGLCAQYSVFEP